MYQLLSEWAEICRRCDKNVLAYFILGHAVVMRMFLFCNFEFIVFSSRYSKGVRCIVVHYVMIMIIASFNF